MTKWLLFSDAGLAEFDPCLFLGAGSGTVLALSFWKSVLTQTFIFNFYFQLVSKSALQSEEIDPSEASRATELVCHHVGPPTNKQQRRLL